MSKIVPKILQTHILPFNWDVCKVWALEASVERVLCTELSYLLDLPLWSSVPDRGLLFDIRPIDVIRDSRYCTYQTQRLKMVNLAYPIDILVIQKNRFILDGVHRIAKRFFTRSIYDRSSISRRGCYCSCKMNVE
jgi:hypothetical protein